MPHHSCRKAVGLYQTNRVLVEALYVEILPPDFARVDCQVATVFRQVDRK